LSKIREITAQESEQKAISLKLAQAALPALFFNRAAVT